MTVRQEYTTQLAPITPLSVGRNYDNQKRLSNLLIYIASAM